MKAGGIMDVTSGAGALAARLERDYSMFINFTIPADKNGAISVLPVLPQRQTTAAVAAVTPASLGVLSFHQSGQNTE